MNKIIHKLNNIKNFLFSRKNRYWTIGIIVVLIVGFLFFKNGEETEILVVHPGDFIQQFSVSGTVVPVQEVSIAVAQGGPVSSVYVRVGDIVEEGKQLIAIDTASLKANLLSAQADVALKQAEIKNKEVNIDQITQEQNTLVENAYLTMISDDLVAVPLFSYDDLTAPSITGRYSGKEGTYDVIIYRQNITSTDYFLRTYGVEETEPITLLKYGEPTKLGNNGLFISFPDGIENYVDTSWKVIIPNAKSASYVENYNNYIKAVDTRARTIADAKENLSDATGTSILMAQLQKAKADVQKILADINQRIIKAPFSGIVTNVNVKVGETASTNQVAIEMMSSGAFQIESYIPEIYIPLIKVGNEAQVILDAYGPEKVFGAKVVAIDPAKTIRDGLPTYKTTLEIKESEEEIRNGMTANIVIVTEKKSNVISVPQGVVKSRGDKKFVDIKENGKITAREVKIGIISSLGEVEIISGLKDGDVVIIKSGK